MGTTDVRQQRYRAFIDAAKLGSRVTQAIAPIAAGSPRRRLEDEPAPEAVGDNDVPQKVLAQGGVAGEIVECTKAANSAKSHPPLKIRSVSIPESVR